MATDINFSHQTTYALTSSLSTQELGKAVACSIARFVEMEPSQEGKHNYLSTTYSAESSATYGCDGVMIQRTFCGQDVGLYLLSEASGAGKS